MYDILPLYHGSTVKVDKPTLSAGKKNNDYGQGFYCTEHYDLACEWASKVKDLEGYVNSYDVDMIGLKVLDLSKPDYNILNWITILLQNRTFVLNNPISIQAKEYLIANFNVDTSEYDIIKGYRADDSYFSYAEDFLNNTITVKHLAKAMKLGELGIQYALVSEKAFEQLRFREAEKVDSQTYYARYTARDLKARTAYRNSKAHLEINNNDLFVADIIRRGIVNGDSSIS